MSNAVVLAAVELIAVHMIDGRLIQMNPHQITQLVSPRENVPNKTFPVEVKCVVRFVDGTYASLAETCDTVRELMEGKER